MPNKRKQVYQEVEKLAALNKQTCTFLWDNPEVGGTEVKSAAYMRDMFVEEGFKLVNEPKVEHAFYAEYGSGHPVI